MDVRKANPLAPTGAGVPAPRSTAYRVTTQCARLLGLLLLVAGAQAWAQKPGKLSMLENNPHLAKVSSHLLSARRQVQAGADLQTVVSANPLLRGSAGLLAVEIKLRKLDDDILQRVQDAGVETEQWYFEYAVVNGRIAPEQLDELAAIGEVRTVHPPYGYQLHSVGSVSNQADVSIRADQARSTFGVSGAGLTIGVLSDSFHDTILGGGSVTGGGCARELSGSDPQVSGDLPDPLVVLDNGGGGNSDEGAGMAELIADLAPAADIMFHSAFVGGQAGFAAGITELAGCGADVIVDDVFYFAEPLFQDGFIAKAAQDAVDAGIPFYSSAGNSASLGVHDVYTDASGTNDIAFPPTGVDFHVFAGGNEYAEIANVPKNCGATFILQWNEPFDGTQGAGARTDLDLYICDSQNSPLSDCTGISTAAQGNCAGAPAGDPLEIGTYTNTGNAPETVYLAVDHYCGPGGAATTPPVEFRIVTLDDCGSAMAFEPGVFNKMQVGGHSAADGAVAVAAVFYGEIDFNGDVLGTPGVINVESFSSLGGDIPYYFTHDGQLIPGAPELRFKPEIAAPDGTNTTFFGSDIGFDADSHPNFFGTSAAAPHAAAVAALLLDASPDLAPAGISQVLQASARDIETFGKDNLSGAGLIDAVNAVQTVTDAGIGCSPSLFLSDHTIRGNQYFRACQQITAHAGLTVDSAAQLTLEVGNAGGITLGAGFNLQPGGSLDAVIANDF